MGFRINRVTIHLVVMITLLWCGLAQAGLSAQVWYSSCSSFDNPCPPWLTATSTTNSPVAVGDSNGGASAQSNYGVLDASASSSWILADPPYEGYTLISSNGIAESYFDDTLTVSGGTGNVQVTVTMQLNGVITDSIEYYPYAPAGSGDITARIDIGAVGQQAYLSLQQGGHAGGMQISGLNATWVSENGTFTSEVESYGGIFPVSANGTLTWVASVPYDTPVPINVRLSAVGYASVASNAHAIVKIFVPGGTTVSSASGVNYAVATANASVPMLPTAGFWLLLGVLGLIGVVFSKSKSFN